MILTSNTSNYSESALITNKDNNNDNYNKNNNS